jgi:outer membrane receptor for ferrienterochelin and colicin
MVTRMKYVLISIFCLLIAQFALAQEGLEVTVSDLATEQPVAGITVHLENIPIGFQSQKATNVQGKVQFTGLSTSGTYSVLVDDNEEYFGTKTENIILRSNKKSSVNLFLSQKENRAEEVTVEGTATTKINTIDAEVSSELQAEDIQTIPVEGRDLTRVLFRLPNVTQATGFFPEAPNVSINGANSLYTSYLIDGLDNNENFLGGQKFAIPTGPTQNVTVLTSNYSNEFGLSGNGIVNVTTKSGSNNLNGEAFYVVRPGPAIDGDSPFAQRDLSGNQVKDGFQRHQGGIELGGPIVRDKTFFYVDAEQTFDLKDNLLNSPELGVNETVGGENRFTFLTGKVDQTWNDNFKSNFRVNSGFVNIERQGGGLDGGVQFPSAANSQDRDSLLFASQNIYLHGNVSSETSLLYSRFRWNYGRPENPDSPQVTVLDPSEQTIAVLGHPGFVFDELENTWQFNEKIDYFTGNHSFKFGAGVKTSDFSLLGGGNVNGNYLVKLNEDQLDQLRVGNHGSNLDINDIPSDVQVLNYNVELRTNSFGARQNIYSFYLEDLFSISSNLNLTFGLRYDYDNLSKGGSTDGDKNNFAPRVNFNYRINDRSSFRGGYGLYYDKILYAIYSDALQFSTTSPDYRSQIQELIRLGILPSNTDVNRVTNEGNLSATFQNVSYLNGPSPEDLQGLRDSTFSNELRILNPNGYKNPSTHQMSLGYQFQVKEDKLFYVDVMHTRSYNLFRLRDLNAPSTYPLNDPSNVVVRTQAEADATRAIPIFVDAQGPYAIINGQIVRGIARNIVVTETEGQSSYYAANFTYQKSRMNDNYSYLLFYTLSSLRNNTEDINFRAEDANNFGDEWGPSINDRRHVLSAVFDYYPIKNFTFTIAALLQSGQPINRIPDARIFGTTDLNGDGRSFGDAYVGNSDRFPGESRNNDRLPWSNTFDIGGEYNWSNVILRADIFNVFNANNLSGYSNNATQSNQIQAGAKSSGVIVQRNAAPPRQFQFTIRYLF